jgi:hypothetical protein
MKLNSDIILFRRQHGHPAITNGLSYGTGILGNLNWGGTIQPGSDFHALRLKTAR